MCLTRRYSMRHLRFGAHCFVLFFLECRLGRGDLDFRFTVSVEMDWIGTSQHPANSCHPAAPNLNCHYITKSIRGILCCLDKTGLVVPRGSFSRPAFLSSRAFNVDGVKRLLWTSHSRALFSQQSPLRRLC